MFKPKKQIKLLKHQELFCDDKFTILCWNVAKLTFNNTFKEYLKSIIKHENIDILLLQEFKKQVSAEIDIGDYSYILSPNIETKNSIFGVLNAFNFFCEKDISLLTKKQELKYATHKSSLITVHKIKNNEILVLVNIHAINFVQNSAFFNELNYIKSNIESYKGALIVAGDFNTWNRQRVRFLNKFTDDLSLKNVSFADDSHLKKVLKNNLDYVFYRGLKVLGSKVIDSKKISDHNPIVVKFTAI